MLKKEIGYNFIFTFLTSVILFIQNKYFICYMGVEILGIMKLFSQLLQYLNIIELGLGSASTFALYKPLAEKNKEQISIIISTVGKIYNKIAIILLLLGILFIPTLPYIMKINNFTYKIYIYWFLYLINTVSTYLYVKYIVLFTANQEFIYIRIIQSMSKIFYQIIQIIFIKKYQSFSLFILLLLLDNLTQYIFFKIHYKKKYSYIYSTKEKYIGLKRNIKNLFWHKIGSLVVFNTDLILISKLVSIEIVGVYANYQLIIQMISTIVGIITNVIRPKIGKFVSINPREKTFLLFKELNLIFLLISIFFSFVTYKVMNSFINLWLGKSLNLTNITVALICINILIKIFRNIIDIFKESYGFFDDIQAPILESIINLVVSIILGVKYGLNGIIIGTIISNIVVILIYRTILVFKRCFDKGVKEYVKIYGNYLILLIITIFSLSTVTKLFIKKSIDNYFEWICYATVISSITIVILLIIFLLSKDFRSLIKKYLKKN